MGRALLTAKEQGWKPTAGWWEWKVPGRQEPLSFVCGSWGALCHAIRDALRHAAVQRLAARRPRLYQGLGVAANKQLVQPALRGLEELDAVLLRGAMACAVWTAQRAPARGLRGDPLCPYCDMGAPEDEEHIFYACPAWEQARSIHLADLQEAAQRAHALGLMDSWPPCLRLCGLLPEVRLVAPTAPRPRRRQAQAAPRVLQVCTWASCGAGFDMVWLLEHANPCLCNGGASMPPHPYEAVFPDIARED